MTAAKVTRPATALPTVRILPVSVRDRNLIDLQGAWVAEFGDRAAAQHVASMCNAYPKLVAALRQMVPYANSEMSIGWNAPEREQIDEARALLRSLGEGV